MLSYSCNYYSNQFFLCNNIEIPGESMVYADVYSKYKMPKGDVYISGEINLPAKFKEVNVFDSSCKGESPKMLIINMGSTPIQLPKRLLIGSMSGANNVNLLIECENAKAETSRHERFLKEREQKFKIIKDPDVSFGDKFLFQKDH